MLQAVALAAVAGYAGLAALLWLLQDKLLFFPRPAPVFTRPPPGWSLEKATIMARDGTRLAGVIVKPPGGPAPLVVYFGGNAEEVTGWAPAAEQLGMRALLLVNYRGYGDSEGRPSEKSLVGDALEICDWASKRADVDGARVAVYGRSLGTGVAVQVAAQRPVRAVVLASPYDSVLEVGRASYPFFPVAWLLRHPFDSAVHAPRIQAPALFLYGTADTLIDKRHSERLASLWGGPAQRAALEGRGHNDLDADPLYYPAVRGFLDRHL